MVYKSVGYHELLIEHYTSKWGDYAKKEVWDKGPMTEVDPLFSILKFPPRSGRNMWTYATCGMSNFDIASPIELHLFSFTEDDELIELLTAIAHYHKTGNYLNFGHTVNFGKPWQQDSRCDYGLISLPYLDGPELEVLDVPAYNQQIHCYWLVPITKDEVEYKKQFGLEKLESLFDAKELNYVNPDRASVVE